MIKITRVFKDFTNSERSAGYVLIGVTLLSLLLANVFFGEAYGQFFHHKIGFENTGIHLDLSLEHWVNDGLMTIFFLLVGLEIEREIYAGELSNLQNASLPVAAALGGIIIPFTIHFAMNYGSATQAGSGIPMATDIAFALGILSLSKKVPHALKVFLTAFAIIDDLGAIIIIAIFYSKTFQLFYLVVALLIFAVLLICNRMKVVRLWPYFVLGTGMWYCMLQSGVHGTIAGVLLAFALPFGTGDANSPSYKVQHFLHKPVAFFVLPVFALVNTGIVIPKTWLDDLQTKNSLGILTGLVIGKPLGIMAMSNLVIKLGWSRLPAGVTWRHLIGVAFLGGIGFTMSIFISLLAFSDPKVVDQSKIAVFISSILASVLGLAILRKKHIFNQTKMPI